MAVNNPRMRTILQTGIKAPAMPAAAQAAVPKAMAAAGTVPPIVSPQTVSGSKLPGNLQSKFMQTQLSVLRNVVSRGVITEAEIPTLIHDKAKDGQTLRAIVERKMLETPGDMKAAVKAAADEYHGFLEGIKKTSEAQGVAPAPVVQMEAAPVPEVAARAPKELTESEVTDIVRRVEPEIKSHIQGLIKAYETSKQEASLK